jgi:hypothetical protein
MTKPKDFDTSDYKLYYKKYVDSKEPLSVLHEKDVKCVRESETYLITNGKN